MSVYHRKRSRIALNSVLFISMLSVWGCGPSTEELAMTSLVETQAAASPTYTSTPAPTATPTLTATPQPTATRKPTSTSTPLSPGDIIFFTSFGSTAQWTMLIFGSAETIASGLFSDPSKRWVDGAFYLDVDTPNTSKYLMYQGDLGSNDIRLDAVVETVAGPNHNNINLICRSRFTSWYEFSMNSGGSWKIWKYDRGDGYTVLAGGTSRAINTQLAKNEMTVICKGAVLSLFFNGKEAGTVSDYTFAEGSIGIGVSTFDIGGARVKFEKLTVSVP
ncbi:MAG: hypothetical protein OEZ02_03690 [Anaerolineae bacterium]|nr:hypothetical protein [Anaerolineae bacterium]